MNKKQKNKNMLGIGTMLFVLTLIFSVGTASASGPTWTAKPGWNAPDAGYQAAPAFADLDGDGDQDLLIGEWCGDSYGYENTGTPSSPAWTAKSSWDAPDVGGFTAPAFADLDGDGDYDLLIGEAHGVSIAYENTGTPSSPAWTAKSSWDVPDVGNNARPAFADLDGDGDQDLLISEAYGGSYAYENTGTSSSPAWTAKPGWDAPGLAQVNARPAFADLDGDGDYDLLLGGYVSGDSFAYENTGTTSSPAWTAKSSWDAPDVGMYAAPAFTDLDGDGDYDLLIGERYGVSYAYENAPPAELFSTIDLDPDTLNVKSNGEWITAYIELPEGYDVNDIDVSTIYLVDTIPLDTSAPATVGDYDGDGTSDLMVKFDRTAVVAYLGTEDVTEDETGTDYYEELTITGELTDGTPFEGSDTIRVIDKGKGK